MLLAARTPKQAVVTALLALSPPVTFAVERGNVELLVFAGLVLGLRATRDLAPARKDAWRAALFGGLTLLKLFPIAAFAVLAQTPRRALGALAGVAAAALGVIVTCGDHLFQLQPNMAHEIDTNYGRLLLFATDPAVSAWRSPAALHSLAFAALVTAAGSAAGVLWRAPVLRSFGGLLDGGWESDLALAGTAIFGLTFLIGLNYDYRLIFLLLLVPAFFHKDGGSWNTPAGAAAAALLLRLSAAHRLPDAWLGAADWALLAALCTWTAASLSHRLRPRCAPAFAGAASAPI